MKGVYWLATATALVLLLAILATVTGFAGAAR